jgi:hypothetical protein
MISLKELNPKSFPLTPEMTTNLDKLLVAMNVVRAAYGKPMFITSGVRSLEDHKRIYMEIARAKGITNPRIPMGSKHLKAAACDVLDQDGSLYAWCKANDSVLAQAGVYLEEDRSAPRVHFQVIPFGSYKPGGSRWFRP